MPAQYKVIYRAGETATDVNHTGWERGCPILIEALQVARNIEDGSAFLQTKIENITSKRIDSVFLEGTVTFYDESTTPIVIRTLDADLEPCGSKALTPLPLENGEVAGISLKVSSTIDADGITWKSTGDPAPLPPQIHIDLSPDLWDERVRELESCGMNEASPSYEPADFGEWWLCTCGQLNLGTDRCLRCHVYKAGLFSLPDSDTLAANAMEHAKEQAAKTKKRNWIIASSVCGICAIAIALYFLIPVFNQMSLDSKFDYVENHMDVSDSTTYHDLIDLINADYLRAKTIYTQLYGWDIDGYLSSSPDGIGSNTRPDSRGFYHLYLLVKANPPANAVPEVSQDISISIKVTYKYTDGTSNTEPLQIEELSPTGSSYKSYEVDNLDLEGNVYRLRGIESVTIEATAYPPGGGTPEQITEVTMSV